MRFKKYYLNYAYSDFPITIVVWFFLCLFIFSNLSAQVNVKPTSITTKDGLGFRKVTAIVQDNRGIMWFGSLKGINRYDGYRFSTFSSAADADVYFPAEHVPESGMILMDLNTIWVLGDSKLHSLDLCSYSWKEIILPSKFQGNIRKLFKSRDEKIWVVTDNGVILNLLSYDKSTGEFKSFAKSVWYKTYLNYVESDTFGNIWWSTPADGIRQFNSEGVILRALKPDSNKILDSKVYSIPLFISRKNELFLFPESKNELWKYDLNQSRIEVIAKNLNSPIYNALEDREGNIWFSFDIGILKYNPQKAGNAVIDYTPYLQNTLSFTDIHGLYEDQMQILWIATNNGIIKLPIGKQPIRQFVAIEGVEWGNEMRGIVQGFNEKIYAYCENGQQGFYEIDKLSGSVIRHYPFGDRQVMEKIVEGVKNLIPDSNRNLIWCLTDKLLQINLRNMKGYFIKDFNEITDKNNHNPLGMLNDKSLILGATLSKLHIYHPGSGLTQKFTTSSTEFDLINTECFEQDDYGNIWVGTNKGIFIFNKLGQVLKRIDQNSIPGLSKNHILCMMEDKTGNFYVGTFGGGIHKIIINPTGIAKSTNYELEILNYNHKNGLCNDNITACLEDRNGFIWISTYNGLSRFDPVKNAFQNYFTEDGISNNEFNYTSSFIDNEGYLWFGGMNGVNVINPNEGFGEIINPPLALTYFTKYNEKVGIQTTLINDNYQQEPFIIKPEDSWFQFNWTLPNYFNSEKNNYYAWMEGLDKTWSYIGNNPQIKFNHLPSGSYILHVKATDSKRNLSMGQLHFPVEVIQVFYETWWFRLISVLTILGIINYINKYKLRKRLELEAMRTQIASDLHDEVGSMLSGLAMQSELLQSQNYASIKPQLENISSLSRSIIKKMRDLVWSIDSRRDSMQNLLDKMQEQAADLFQPKDIYFRFVFSDLPREKQLSVMVRQQLFLIFNEAITNIVRHSDADEVLIRIANSNEGFVMKIKDNGKPKEKSIVHTGMGLENMMMRAKKINAKMQFEYDDGFAVTLSMKRV